MARENLLGHVNRAVPWARQKSPAERCTSRLSNDYVRMPQTITARRVDTHKNKKNLEKGTMPENLGGFFQQSRIHRCGSGWNEPPGR